MNFIDNISSTIVFKSVYLNLVPNLDLNLKSKKWRRDRKRKPEKKRIKIIKSSHAGRILGDRPT
jgi:hypothetical protein